ncbi:hypothetical protein [Streptomyces sp. NPDC058872]|uniref:hypothetical protein n=1 Tax=Streptomyces sp. NPDC058872 TaxID=3346661 RepID=UPI003695B5AA
MHFDDDVHESFLVAAKRPPRTSVDPPRPDRNVAALRIIRPHPTWSDRVITAAAGPSPKTVGSLLRRSHDAIPHLDVATARDVPERTWNSPTLFEHREFTMLFRMTIPVTGTTGRTGRHA